jgi:hypothetical protein
MSRKPYQLLPPAKEEQIGPDEHRAGVRLDEGYEGGVDDV